MGRNDVFFGDARRKAIAAAMLEGRTAPEVVKMAAAGELGLPTFEVSETTCRSLAQTARRDPRRLAELADRILTMCERLVDQIEKQSRPSNVDIGRLKRLIPLAEHAARAGNTADQLLRRKPPAIDAAADDSRGATLLAKLAAQQDSANGAEPDET